MLLVFYKLNRLMDSLHQIQFVDMAFTNVNILDIAIFATISTTILNCATKI